MAVDGYMYFMDYQGKYLTSELTVDVKSSDEPLFVKFNFAAAKKANGLFQIEDFSFDIEMTLNISSQSTGVGANAVGFNPYSFTRKIDRATPKLFEMACSGTPFQRWASRSGNPPAAPWGARSTGLTSSSSPRSRR